MAAQGVNNTRLLILEWKVTTSNLFFSMVAVKDYRKRKKKKNIVANLDLKPLVLLCLQTLCFQIALLLVRELFQKIGQSKHKKNAEETHPFISNKTVYKTGLAKPGLSLRPKKIFF